MTADTAMQRPVDPPAEVDLVTAERSLTDTERDLGGLDFVTAWPTFSVRPSGVDRRVTRESRIKVAYRGLAVLAILVSSAAVALPQMSLRGAPKTMAAAITAGAIGLITAKFAGDFHVLSAQLSVDDAQSQETAPHEGTKALTPEEALLELSHAISEQVHVYQEITTQQAKTAFRSSIAATFLALLVLAGGAGVIVQTRDVALRAVVAAVTSLGVALTTFLGKTFLDMHRRANEQLNRSHAVPLAQHLAYFTFAMAQRVEQGAIRGALVKDIVSTTLAGVEVTLAGFLPVGGEAVNRRVHRRRLTERENQDD